MKVGFKLSNILGSIYHKGTLEFSPDGNCLLSPVGNKVVCYDLQNNRSAALAIEAEYNIVHLSFSPNGRLVLAATEKSQLYLTSQVSGAVLHRKQFHDLGSISCLCFSPDGRYFVVCGGNKALVYLTPGTAFAGGERQLSPFQIHKVVKAHSDDITCVSWSSDSRLMAVGSRDLSVKITAVDQDVRCVPRILSLSGHSDVLVKCFFVQSDASDMDIYSLCRNGQLYHWEANMTNLETDNEEDPVQLNYRKKNRHFLNDHVSSGKQNVTLTAASSSCSGRILVTGFSNGCFLVQDLQELTVIYSLQLSTVGAVDSITINSSGDWVAIGSSVGSGKRGDLESAGSSQSQLVVWEWKTETFVLKQSGTGAGVSNLMECTAYSPDASCIATGSTDGKIRLWNCLTGFCFVTFGEEHRGSVTALEFVANKGGKVLVSASLDGTVRCFDMKRYRNFKTLSGLSESRLPQFICMAVDPVGGDFVVAGAQNTFEIFLWSQETGRLLECLSGHQGPVSGVKFSPASNDLISCSWDGTIRIWSLFQGTKCTRQVIKIGHDATSLSLNQAGTELMVSTINGQIIPFDVESGEQLGTPIDGRCDLGVSQEEDQVSRDRKKYFSSLCYSSDGNYLLAGGNSKFLCIYHVHEKVLVKKLAVTWNLSMDGMYDYISKRKVAEFGFALSQVRNRQEGGDAAIALPGVRKGDMSERSVNPTIAVMSVLFSPTMRSFVATTTEGVLIFSLDQSNRFDPYQLDINVTESSVRQLIHSKQHFEALVQALRLNQASLVQEVMESTPVADVPFSCSSLPLVYVEKCLAHVAQASESSRHLEFYLDWSLQLLQHHAVVLKNSGLSGSMNAVLRHLSNNLNKHFEDVGDLVDQCSSALSFITSFADKSIASHNLCD